MSLLPIQTHPGPYDVVYPIAGGRHGRKVLGSQWDNNELRYSLRSLERYFPNMGRVFIVGHKPAWLTNVIHIPAEDTHRRNKDANLIDKVLLACRGGVSPTFIRLSDDQCLLQPWDGVGAYHAGPAMGGCDDGKWWRRMERTCEYLEGQGRPSLFYDTHSPQPIDREAFMEIMGAVNYQTPPGMCINSLYFNSVDIPRVGMGNRKASFHAPTTYEALVSGIKGKTFFGYSEAGTNDALKRLLQELFPAPSRFEVPGSEVPVPMPPPTKGAGTYLASILGGGWLPKCRKCANMAAKMDRRGLAWCRENTDEIVDNMLKVARLGWMPFSRGAATKLVGLACDLAEEEAKATTTPKAGGTPVSLTHDALEAFFLRIPKEGTVLELGSGKSTGLLLANGNRVVTVEHDPKYLNQHSGAHYIHAPLVGNFYAPEAMQAAIAKAKELGDLVGVVVDGPPKKLGADRCAFATYFGHFSGLPLLIDDTNRRPERALMRTAKRNGWMTGTYGVTKGKKWNLMLWAKG